MPSPKKKPNARKCAPVHVLDKATGHRVPNVGEVWILVRIERVEDDGGVDDVVNATLETRFVECRIVCDIITTKSRRTGSRDVAVRVNVTSVSGYDTETVTLTSWAEFEAEAVRVDNKPFGK